MEAKWMISKSVEADITAQSHVNFLYQAVNLQMDGFYRQFPVSFGGRGGDGLSFWSN